VFDQALLFFSELDRVGYLLDGSGFVWLVETDDEWADGLGEGVG
jgi:hypothetical protein